MHPQPQANLCPNCTLNVNTQTFYVEIEGGHVDDPTLHADCGGPPVNARLPGGPIFNGQTYTLTGLPSGCVSATFSYTTIGGLSMSVPVLIANGP